MNSIWAKQALLLSGWTQNVRFCFENGVVNNIETSVSLGANDELANVIVPGMGNVHSHAFQRGMAGLAEQKSNNHSDNFWGWREIMYHFLDRLSPDDVNVIAQMAYMEMLECGFTQVGEFHYLHHDINGNKYSNIAQMAQSIISASAQTGINISLLPVFYAHSDFGGKAPSKGQRRFICNIDEFYLLYDKCKSLIYGANRIGIAPHSLRAVTQSELSALLEFAPNGPIHIHASEQEKEVNDSIAYYGQRPIEWLFDNYDIDTRWCFIHATHLNDQEVAQLAKSGAVAGLCPLTEANLGDGIFRAEEYLEQNGQIGIGTDSNILIDFARELSALEYSMRLSKRQRNVLANASTNSVGRTLFDAALKGGAQSLDFQAELTINGPATFVELAPADFGDEIKNSDIILDKWIFASRDNCVKSVWVNGKKLVVDGQHINADTIKENYKKTLSSIIKEF